jgi:hypothetical protein
VANWRIDARDDLLGQRHAVVPIKLDFEFHADLFLRRRAGRVRTGFPLANDTRFTPTVRFFD